jgi:ABC-type tungstate transport system substrate-binding protein
MFSEIKTYLYAAVGVLILGLSITIAFQHQKIVAEKHEVSELNTKLTASNSSVTALTKALQEVSAQLQAAHEADVKKQAEVDVAIKVVRDKDKSLERLEATLKERKPETDCKTPKDLKDAWNNL